MMTKVAAAAIKLPKGPSHTRGNADGVDPIRFDLVSDEDRYAAYRDPEGQPRLAPSRELFFDLLGVKAMAQSPDALGGLQRLRPVLKQAVDRAMTEDTEFRQASTWFTDNAVVAAPVDAVFSEVVFGMAEVSAAYLMLICWEAGFLGRGAITFGPHYMDEDFVFGPALVEAVELEKSTRWPRIALGPSAVDIERLHSGYYGGSLTSAQAQCLICDEEGTVFVDPLGIYIDEEDDWDVLDHHLKRLHKATVDALATLSPHSEPWLKWRWLADYQNWALQARLADPERYLVPIGQQRLGFATFLDPRPDTAPGSPWFVMDRMDQYRLDQPGEPPMPEGPGVYAIYDSERDRLFVECARNLDARVRADLGRTPAAARRSALCQAILQQQAYATAAEIEDGRHSLSAQDLAALQKGFATYRIAARQTETLAAARQLKREMLKEFTPPLNR